MTSSMTKPMIRPRYTQTLTGWTWSRAHAETRGCDIFFLMTQRSPPLPAQMRHSRFFSVDGTTEFILQPGEKYTASSLMHISIVRVAMKRLGYANPPYGVASAVVGLCTGENKNIRDDLMLCLASYGVSAEHVVEIAELFFDTSLWGGT